MSDAVDKFIEEQIIANLKDVYDPEISINIYDLGLIYNIDIKDEEVEITHTLTSAWCPFADQIIADIRQAGYVDGIRIVQVVTTFDPPYSIDSVPEETRTLMGW